MGRFGDSIAVVAVDVKLVRGRFGRFCTMKGAAVSTFQGLDDIQKTCIIRRIQRHRFYIRNSAVLMQINYGSLSENYATSGAKPN